MSTDNNDPAPPPGWNPPGQQPPYYPPQQVTYVDPRPQPPNAVLILVLGGVGIIFLPLVAPVAWVMGHRSRQVMAASPPGTYRDDWMVTVGWVLGIVGTVLLLIFLAFMLTALVILLTAAATA